MSKSILVVDTPESCSGCRLENGHSCTYGMRYIENKEFEIIPDWCPLKTVPNKKKKNMYHNSYEDGFVDGFNDFIDEILKGDRV